MNKPLLAIVTALFGLFSAWVVWRVGLLALYTHNLSHPAGAQVFIDLVIEIGLVLTWLWRDARATGRNPWPWVLVTLTCGSFGPLLYLLTRKSAAQGQ